MSDVTAAVDQVVPTEDAPAALQAFQATAARREAIDPDETEHLNVDMGVSAVTVLGALPAIMALKQTLAEELVKFKPEQLTDLKTLALAALFAHSRHRFTATAPETLAQDIEQATYLRNLYVSSWRAAAEHGVVSAEALDERRAPNSHQNVAIDLLGMANLICDNWSALDGKTPLKLPEVRASLDLATNLAEKLGLREHAGKVMEVSLLDKKRAFTLLARAYREVRSMVAYVRRHHGDLEEIAPTFHTRAPARPAQAGSEVPAAGSPSAPAPSVQGAPLPAASAPVGHPDAAPFQQ